MRRSLRHSDTESPEEGVGGTARQCMLLVALLCSTWDLGPAVRFFFFAGEKRYFFCSLSRAHARLQLTNLNIVPVC